MILTCAYQHSQVKEVIYVTRKTHALDRYAEAFSDLLVSVLHGTDLRTAVEECNQNLSGSNSLGGMLFRYTRRERNLTDVPAFTT